MLDPAGYWVAPSSTPLSYPAEGNELCFGLEEGSFWFRHRNAVLADVMRLFPPEGPIFDVGGGNGFVAKGLEAEGFPCVLVEPGEQGAANGVKRGLRTVICSTLEGANFRPGTIGAAGLFDVVEHIQDPAAFLRNLHSLMRPGGRVYVTVPAFEMLWSSEDAYAGHHRRYSARTLREALGGAGFEVEYVSYFFWFLILPVFLFRTIPSLLGLRRARPSAADYAREHSRGPGFLAPLIDAALDYERGRIRRRKRIPFGGSCLAVARRIERV